MSLYNLAQDDPKAMIKLISRTIKPNSEVSTSQNLRDLQDLIPFFKSIEGMIFIIKNFPLFPDVRTAEKAIQYFKYHFFSNNLSNISYDLLEPIFSYVFDPCIFKNDFFQKSHDIRHLIFYIQSLFALLCFPSIIPDLIQTLSQMMDPKYYLKFIIHFLKCMHIHSFQSYNSIKYISDFNNNNLSTSNSQFILDYLVQLSSKNKTILNNDIIINKLIIKTLSEWTSIADFSYIFSDNFIQFFSSNASDPYLHPYLLSVIHSIFEHSIRDEKPSLTSNEIKKEYYSVIIPKIDLIRSMIHLILQEIPKNYSNNEFFLSLNWKAYFKNKITDDETEITADETYSLNSKRKFYIASISKGASLIFEDLKKYFSDSIPNVNFCFISDIFKIIEVGYDNFDQSTQLTQFINPILTFQKQVSSKEFSSLLNEIIPIINKIMHSNNLHRLQSSFFTLNNIFTIVKTHFFEFVNIFHVGNDFSSKAYFINHYSKEPFKSESSFSSLQTDILSAIPFQCSKSIIQELIHQNIQNVFISYNQNLYKSISDLDLSLTIPFDTNEETIKFKQLSFDEQIDYLFSTSIFSPNYLSILSSFNGQSPNSQNIIQLKATSEMKESALFFGLINNFIIEITSDIKSNLFNQDFMSNIFSYICIITDSLSIVNEYYQNNNFSFFSKTLDSLAILICSFISLSYESDNFYVYIKKYFQQPLKNKSLIQFYESIFYFFRTIFQSYEGEKDQPISSETIDQIIQHILKAIQNLLIINPSFDFTLQLNYDFVSFYSGDYYSSQKKFLEHFVNELFNIFIIITNGLSDINVLRSYYNSFFSIASAKPNLCCQLLFYIKLPPHEIETSFNTLATVLLEYGFSQYSKFLASQDKNNVFNEDEEFQCLKRPSIPNKNIAGNFSDNFHDILEAVSLKTPFTMVSFLYQTFSKNSLSFNETNFDIDDLYAISNIFKYVYISDDLMEPFLFIASFMLNHVLSFETDIFSSQEFTQRQCIYNRIYRFLSDQILQRRDLLHSWDFEGNEINFGEDKNDISKCLYIGIQLLFKHFISGMLVDGAQAFGSVISTILMYEKIKSIAYTFLLNADPWMKDIRGDRVGESSLKMMMYLHSKLNLIDHSFSSTFILKYQDEHEKNEEIEKNVYFYNQLFGKTFSSDEEFELSLSEFIEPYQKLHDESPLDPSSLLSANLHKLDQSKDEWIFEDYERFSRLEVLKPCETIEQIKMEWLDFCYEKVSHELLSKIEKSTTNFQIIKENLKMRFCEEEEEVQNSDEELNDLSTIQKKLLIFSKDFIEKVLDTQKMTEISYVNDYPEQFCNPFKI